MKKRLKTLWSYPRVAKVLGIKVRDVQLLVKRGELREVISKVFKIPGIVPESVEQYRIKCKINNKEGFETDTQWITISEAQQILGVSRPTILTHSSMGKLRRVKNMYNKWAYDKASVLAYKAIRDKNKKMSGVNRAK